MDATPAATVTCSVESWATAILKAVMLVEGHLRIG